MRKILGLLAVLTAMGCGPDSINQLCGAGDTCPDKQVCAESGDGTRRCFQNGSIPDLKPATQPDMAMESGPNYCTFDTSLFDDGCVLAP